MFQAITFYIAIQIMHFSTLPLLWYFFKKDGLSFYSIGKSFSPIFISYFVWILAYLGILPYNQLSIFFVILVVSAISTALIWRHHKVSFLNFLTKEKKNLLKIELIFAIAYFLFVLFRAFNPEISYDVNLYAAEKFPDMTFYHSLVRYSQIPPKDLWFAGKGNYINYYYYGYFIVATITKLAKVEAKYGYNLSLAYIFASSIMGAFSILLLLTGKFSFGIIGAFFVNVIGNLYGAVHLLTGKPFTVFDVWKGSRIIEKMLNGRKVDATINEFPAFSYILGDLHAHLLALPLSLVVIYMLASIFVNFNGGNRRESIIRAPFFLLALGSLITANYWDLPGYLALSFLAFFFISIISNNPIKTLFGWLGFLIIGFLLLRFLFFLPFFIHYKPPPAKLSIFKPDEWKLHWTLLDQFLTIHGFFIFLILALLIVLWFNLNSARRKIIVIIPPVIFFIVGIIFTKVAIKEVYYVIPLLLFFLFFSGLTALLTKERIVRFPLFMSFLAFAVLLGCEFIYIKDFYGFPNTRMNTVFKFYYEAWIFLSLSSAYAFYYVLKKTKNILPANLIFLLITAIGFAASTIYPIRAIPVKCDNFKRIRGRPTLNGFAYIKKRFPQDYEACEWLRENSGDDDVVLEVNGKPYDYYGRVAVMSGVPCVLGWGNHESLWRDWTWKIVLQRENDIREMYKSTNVRRVYELLKKYGVTYVFVGTLEEKQFYEYDLNGREKFKNIADVVYDKNNVTIFKVKKDLKPEEIKEYVRKPTLIVPKERGKVVINQEGVKQIIKKSAVKMWGSKGKGQGQFNLPHDIAIDSKGNIYVVDTGNHRIQKFDSQGRYLTSWGTEGTNDGQFKSPVGIAIDKDDYVYIADTWNHRIQKFDSKGNFITKWGSPMMFWAPKDLVVDDDGFIYVVDTGFHRIHKFDKNLKEIKVWGTKGSDPYQFFEPVGICFSPKGELLIADTYNKRISIYSKMGKHIADWYVIGWQEYYTEPFIAYHPDGYYLVSDSRNNRIQIYGLNGKLLALWGEGGSSPSQFSWPFGIAVDRDKNIYVVDSLNSRIMKFSPINLDLLIKGGSSSK